MIALRQAELGEWPTIAEITKLANDQYAQSADPVFWGAYVNSTRSMLLTEKAVLRFVATRGDEIVGSVIYCPPYVRELGGKTVRNPYPEMRLLSVVPHQRNQGIANSLIQICEERALRDQVDAITLHTTPLMAVARAMYERRGYVRYEEIDFMLAADFTVLGYIKTLRGSETNAANSN
jgi:ribosomal protein S18 acetylase RimI-like enzyme